MTVSINERQLNDFLSMQWDKGMAYLKTRFDSLRYEEMEDVIIDSMTALAENVRNGKYQKGDADLGTYFIAICRNQALKKVSRGNRPTFISLIDNRRTTSDDDVNLSDELDFKILSKEQYIQENINNLIDLYDDSAETRESKIQAVQDIISLLTAKCQQLIWGKYRDHIAMKDLAELLGLKNANVAKTSLSRCLDQFEINFKKRIK
jgi:RNA polymerase sigma factor (sigma-70 family)